MKKALAVEAIAMALSALDDPPVGVIQHMGGRCRIKGNGSKHTKKGTGRGCSCPAGSKSMLKKMDWAMMRVFFPKELALTPGANKPGIPFK